MTMWKQSDSVKGDIQTATSLFGSFSLLSQNFLGHSRQLFFAEKLWIAAVHHSLSRKQQTDTVSE